MEKEDLFKEIILINDLNLRNDLFDYIKQNTQWDESFKSRKTASYGVPYNYSGISYENKIFPNYLRELNHLVEKHCGYEPNNCLINYYIDGLSKMGFHSDQFDILADKTGIAIFSLGNKRVMRFKNKNDKNQIVDISLEPNSLFYMSQEVQKFWLHSILESDNENDERISITLRKLIVK